MPVPTDCLACVPDDDASVDLRGMLLSGRCRVHGDPGTGFVACSDAYPFAVAWGRPAAEVVRGAVGEAGWAEAEEWHLMAGGEAVEAVAAVLPGWRRREVVLHRWPPGRPWPEVPAGADLRLAPEGWRAAGIAVDHLPAPLARELSDDFVAARPLAAAFAGGRMVSWCYAPLETETRWDVSVDTLASHRRRGLAGACFAVLAREMERRGRLPVWGAFDENTPSLRLAAKLGFAPAAWLASFLRAALKNRFT
jgi:GNAT superfamily N-acetyltransferase